MGNGTKTPLLVDASRQKVAASNFEASLRAQHELHDWLRIDEHGRCEYIPADKHGIVEELQIPYRDLRMVDPLIPIPYPSAIFIRDRALVVNLENIRMIICHDQAFFLGVPGTNGAQDWEPPTESNWFVEEVLEHLRGPEPSVHSVPSILKASVFAYNSKRDVALPYEMRVLESALWGCHHQLQREVDMLDGPAGSAQPAISALIQKVDRGNLERMRDVKFVMTDLINRVGAIKKELEDILDDDEDMADMYLERRAALLDAAAASRAASARASDAGTPEGSPRGAPSRSSSFSDHRNSHHNRVSPHDIEEAENLVESYFMQMNLLLGRLYMVKERIDDTEDLINIELDHRRNELVAFNLIVTILAAAFGFVAMIGGIFGMNLHPLPIESSSAGFYSATFGGIGLALLLLGGLLGYARTKGILFIPEAKL